MITIRIIPVLFLIILLPAITAGQQTQFETANTLMEDYQFTEALEYYRSIEDRGYHSGELFFNMGLASLYQDSLGLAKSYFMQSSRYRETSAEARSALDYLESRFEQRSAVLPQLPWERFFNWIDTRFGTGLMGALSLLFLNTGIALLIAGWFYTERAFWLKIGSRVLLASALLFFLVTLYLSWNNHRYSDAVTIDARAHLYEQPQVSATPSGTAYEGFAMRVNNPKSADASGWLYVRLENGRYGWIEANRVRTF